MPGENLLPLHATPVKHVVRAVFRFDWRVGVLVCLRLCSFLFLSLAYKLKSLIGANHLGRLLWFSLPLFVGMFLLLGISGKEELDVRQLDLGIRLCTPNARVSGCFRSVRATPFWRCCYSCYTACLSAFTSVTQSCVFERVGIHCSSLRAAL